MRLLPQVSRRAIYFVPAVGIAIMAAVMATASTGGDAPAEVVACSHEANPEAAGATVGMPAAEAYAGFYESARAAASRSGLEKIPLECEILLVPERYLDEADLRLLIGSVPKELAISRVHVAFPTEGRTTVSHFGIPRSTDIDGAIESWKKEVRFSIEENLTHALDEEFRAATMADLEKADAEEFDANQDQYVADAASLLEQLEKGTFVVYGIRIATNENADKYMDELSATVEAHQLGVAVIARGSNPIGFRSPVDPSRDQKLVGGEG